MSLLKNFTAIPVNIAEIIVPSLVPTILKLKKMRERTTAKDTHKMSKIIFIFPKSFFEASEITLTNASPEFRITFAVTESDIPNPRTIILIITIASFIKYDSTGIFSTIITPTSVNHPNKNEIGI